jgi:hypothetical protein
MQADFWSFVEGGFFLGKNPFESQAPVCGNSGNAVANRA